jgi:hypothetical protein
VTLAATSCNVGRAARLLWPGRHNAELARFAGVPHSTARSWARGHRRPPLGVLRAMEHRLATFANEAGTIRLWLATEVSHRQREPRLLRGCVKQQAAGISHRRWGA